MEIRPVRAKLFYADRQTEMTKLIVAFRDFAKAILQTRLNSNLCKGTKGSWGLRLTDFKTIGTLRWSGCQAKAPAYFTLQKICL